MAEGVFPTSEKIPTSGIIPELGIQFPISENGFRCRGTVSDIGKQFPMSENSFRYWKTVSDVGEQFPISENSFQCRKTISDIGKRFTLSGNISIALNRSAQSKRADYTIDLVRSQ